jgi:hypothetical protein
MELKRSRGSMTAGWNPSRPIFFTNGAMTIPDLELAT